MGNGLNGQTGHSVLQHAKVSVKLTEHENALIQPHGTEERNVKNQTTLEGSWKMLQPFVPMIILVLVRIHYIN